MKKRNIIKKIVYPVIWLVIWQVISLLVSNQIMIVGPYETFLALINLVQTGDFWISILNTILRICLGYLLGITLGILLAYLSYKVKFFEDFLSPLFTFLKATPVASFVIILLIWFGNTNLSFIISTMIVMPIMYSSTLTGLNNTNVKMIEMSNIYKLKTMDKIRYLYFPEVKPQLVSNMVLSSGMAWKSGVAAEVIAQPLRTIGNSMYVSKIYLETDKLFAWTIVVILLSKLFELIVKLIFKGGKKHDKT